MSTPGIFSIASSKNNALQNGGANETTDTYENLFSGVRKNVGSTSTKESIKKREKDYQTLVNSYYDLATDFYQYGWGQSFHFAPRLVGETFIESIKRSEYFLALKMGVGKGDKVLDVGCGVGGPLRNIASFTGASVTGVTINNYQVKVGNQKCASLGLDSTCKLKQGDFQKIGEMFEKNTFDAAYTIEATCHSPDRVKCYKGVARSLKKGGIFVGYDWVVLPERKFDEKNPDHVRVKEGIEVGNGLPTLTSKEDIIKALNEAGFKVIESYDANKDMHTEYQIPWYQTLAGDFSFSGFRMTRIGRSCTHVMISLLETLRIAPKGTTRVSSILSATALDLVEGGKEEIFTPSFYFKAVKK